MVAAMLQEMWRMWRSTSHSARGAILSKRGRCHGQVGFVDDSSFGCGDLRTHILAGVCEGSHIFPSQIRWMSTRRSCHVVLVQTFRLFLWACAAWRARLVCIPVASLLVDVSRSHASVWRQPCSEKLVRGAPWGCIFPGHVVTEDSSVSKMVSDTVPRRARFGCIRRVHFAGSIPSPKYGHTFWVKKVESFSAAGFRYMR